MSTYQGIFEGSQRKPKTPIFALFSKYSFAIIFIYSSEIHQKIIFVSTQLYRQLDIQTSRDFFSVSMEVRTTQNRRSSAENWLVKQIMYHVYYMNIFSFQVDCTPFNITIIKYGNSSYNVNVNNSSQHNTLFTSVSAQVIKKGIWCTFW